MINLQNLSKEERQAVLEMEASLGTDESVVTEALPEDTYVSEYLGTFVPPYASISCACCIRFETLYSKFLIFLFKTLSTV